MHPAGAPKDGSRGACGAGVTLRVSAYVQHVHLPVAGQVGIRQPWPGLRADVYPPEQDGTTTP